MGTVAEVQPPRAAPAPGSLYDDGAGGWLPKASADTVLTALILSLSLVLTLYLTLYLTLTPTPNPTPNPTPTPTPTTTPYPGVPVAGEGDGTLRHTADAHVRRANPNPKPDP